MARTTGINEAAKTLFNQSVQTVNEPFDAEKEKAELGIVDQPDNAKKRGRPLKDDLIRDKSAQEGLTKEWTRATFIMSVDTLDRLKDYAYTERLSLKEAMDDILKAFLDDYQKDHELLKHRGR